MKNLLVGLVTCLFLLILLLLIGLQVDQKRVMDQLHEHQMQIVSRFESLDRINEEKKMSLQVLKESMDQQTMVIHRALGEIIPVTLPPDLDSRIKSLEAKLDEAEVSLKTKDDMDAFVIEVRELTEAIPPWIEEQPDLLTRLNRIRWNAAAFSQINAAENADPKELTNYIDSMNSLLESSPDEVVPDEIRNRVVTAINSSEARWNKFRRQEAVKEAEQKMNSEANVQDLASVIDNLSEWNAMPNAGEDEKALEENLRRKLGNLRANEFIRSGRNELSNLKNISDADLKNLMLNRLLGNCADLRIELESLNSASEDTKSELATFYTEIKQLVEQSENESLNQESEEFAQKRRQYQALALGKITQFNMSFEDRIRGFNDTNGIASDMEIHLVPISTTFLDPAVMKLYTEAFEKGWNKINSEQRIRVATSEALVPKKIP